MWQPETNYRQSTSINLHHLVYGFLLRQSFMNFLFFTFWNGGKTAILL